MATMYSRSNSLSLLSSTSDMDQFIDQEVALLGTVFFRGGTEIPVKEWNGEDAALYNRNNSKLAFLDNRGYSVLEPGGVYTFVKLSDPEYKDVPFTTVRDFNARKSNHKTETYLQRCFLCQR
jgi:hypothetical protein